MSDAHLLEVIRSAGNRVVNERRMDFRPARRLMSLLQQKGCEVSGVG
jgi:hypothetical protein